VCTDVFNFSTASILGPHFSVEVCDGVGLENATYTFEWHIINGTVTANETDAALAGLGYAWRYGSNVPPASAMVGYWQSDAHVCVNISMGPTPMSLVVPMAPLFDPSGMPSFYDVLVVNAPGTLSWQQSNISAAQHGGRLPTLAELVTFLNGSPYSQDLWWPVSDYINAWASVGSASAAFLKLRDQLSGQSGYPANWTWGTDSLTQYSFKASMAVAKLSATAALNATCILEMRFACGSGPYVLNCSNGVQYLGGAFFGTGSMSPSDKGNGGMSQSFACARVICARFVSMKMFR
jgi:hypothetical protein